MLTEADIAAAKRIRVPTKFAYQNRDGTIDASCIARASEVLDATITSYRSRGPNFKRLKATTGDGATYVVDLVSNSFDVTDLAPTAVIRGTGCAVIGDVLEIEDARFREIEARIDEGNRLKAEAHASWRYGINYVSELEAVEGHPVRPGLRPPQIGALHAIAAHWSLSNGSAIVVMPTGTGKTEVMLAVTVESRGDRVLVIVPTDALRQQTADKFREYGLLRRLGIVTDVKNPVVGVLTGKPTAAKFNVIRTCNVVVTTMASISRGDEHEQMEFAALFSEVFFDEAHHAQATTWNKFSGFCGHARMLLFTATPFREDGKALNGKIIYNYPLQLAQENEFFKTIQFLQIFEPDSSLADLRIAQKAVEKLRADLANGLDHMLLARANTIGQAKKLYEDIYNVEFPDLHPVLVHSQTRGREQVLRNIRCRQHRIVICVDMFGEGFDLPQLKVAALHSVHKSLGITLQFIGRFARAAENVGDASFVANTAEDGVPEALESLYQEDADWNNLLSDLSYDAIEPQARLSELVENLQPLEEMTSELEISTLTMKPKLSTEVFRVPDFDHTGYHKAFRPTQIIYQPIFSQQDQMLVFIVNQEDKVDWTDSRDIVIDTWDLFVVFYDEERELLFINSSRKYFASKLAQRLSTDPQPVRDEDVFRAFSNLRRLILHSVGLTGLSRNVRYQMFAGLDVRDAIDPVLQQDKMKSNVMGVGYEDGQRVSIGCSRKGKIWSLQTDSLAGWRDWCRDLGAKLSNENIEPNDFLKHTLIPELRKSGTLPDQQAMMIDWPDQLFESTSFKITVVHGDDKYSFHQCQLDLVEWTPAGNAFTFKLKAGSELECVLRMTLISEDVAIGLFYSITHVEGPEVSIEAFNKIEPAVEFFTTNPPLVRLADGSQLSGEILLKPREELAEVFDHDLISQLAWGDTLLNQESRWSGEELRPRSIQQKFIEHLEQGPSAFIIDDDDAGESADIVAIEDTEDTITVTLWHCKFSSGAAPGNRVKDLYEVCGQAQKSTKWTWNFANLVAHLTERETKHRGGRPSRFVRGSLDRLVVLRKASRRKYVVFRVGIVQPGLSKAGIGNEHLAILGATSLFLRTVTNHPLMVISS
jgi:superfamily II DNA or RNA helicase